MNKSNYKLYPAKISVFLFLAACLFSFSGCFGESEITETEVLEVINKIDTAAQNKDADAIVANMAERAQLKATVTALGQTQTLSYNRDQYRDVVKKAFAVAGSYSHNRQNMQVKIAPDGKTAMVISEETESMTLNGQEIRTTQNSVSSFVRENGKLVILFNETNGKLL